MKDKTCAIKSCYNKPNTHREKYFIIPKPFFPSHGNTYVLCDDHKDINLEYEYFYDENGKNIYKKDNES